MAAWQEIKPTAALVLSNGKVFYGMGLGAKGAASGEVVFNTAMTGYQEILTDPSYAEQIITFTFPHIGNIGTNEEDQETVNTASNTIVRGAILRADITEPSNYRSSRHLDAWLEARNIVAMCGIDTRALTNFIRENGSQNAVIAHNADGVFDIDALKAKASSWAGLEGLDLAKDVSTAQTYQWTEGSWTLENGFSHGNTQAYHIVAIDYGTKANILRLFADLDARITVVNAQTSAADILAHKPDGVFLSNGPGDPAATGAYAVPVIREIIASNLPVFGICLGHQMLALALGGNTLKMHQGHHGANHPVKDFTTHKVEIVSMNHGFAVDASSLPDGVEETHVSLFDGTNCGLRLSGKPVFSVQHHPEASPGPQDSHYLFRRFMNMIRENKGHELLDERPKPADMLIEKVKA